MGNMVTLDNSLLVASEVVAAPGPAAWRGRAAHLCMSQLLACSPACPAPVPCRQRPACKLQQQECCGESQ